MSKKVMVFVGTSKGGFIFNSGEKRRKWQTGDIHFKSWNVMHMQLDPRDQRLHAATTHFVYGPTTHYSEAFMDSHQNSSSAVPKIIGVIVAILTCCACAVILGAAAILYLETRPATALEPLPSLPPILQDTDTPPPTVELTRPPIESITPNTLQTLLNSDVPENNPYDLACRLNTVV